MGSHTTFHTRESEDGDVEIEVEFTLKGGSPPVTSGPPEFCDPGEPPEFEVESAWIVATGEVVELADDEVAKIEADVMDRLGDFDDGDDYPEPDYD